MSLLLESVSSVLLYQTWIQKMDASISTQIWNDHAKVLISLKTTPMFMFSLAFAKSEAISSQAALIAKHPFYSELIVYLLFITCEGSSDFNFLYICLVSFSQQILPGLPHSIIYPMTTLLLHRPEHSLTTSFYPLSALSTWLLLDRGRYLVLCAVLW